MPKVLELETCEKTQSPVLAQLGGGNVSAASHSSLSIPVARF